MLKVMAWNVTITPFLFAQGWEFVGYIDWAKRVEVAEKLFRADWYGTSDFKHKKEMEELNKKWE